MKSADGLANMEVNEMFHEISREIGRELGLGERLQIAMLSGAYKAGGGVVYDDLSSPAREVRFPDYLASIGYPLSEEERR